MSATDSNCESASTSVLEKKCFSSDDRILMTLVIDKSIGAVSDIYNLTVKDLTSA